MTESSSSSSTAAAATGSLQRRRQWAQPGLVVVCDGPQSYSFLVLSAGAVYQNRHGCFKHDDLIGAPFGTKVLLLPTPTTCTANIKDCCRFLMQRLPLVSTECGPPSLCPPLQIFSKQNGFIYLLEVTPELWTKVLNHRTQILFSTDIAMVIGHLGLRPGCVVIETGTGSGSLSVSLARAVAPLGQVHTFEFNAERAVAARQDFARMNLSHVITVSHRDSCAEGFGDGLDGLAQGVFLDLPQPWLALPHAKRALARCGVLCSFSPCIEQVQRTCVELAAMGFEDIRTLETLMRPFDLFTAPLQPSKLDMIAAQPDNESAAAAEGRGRKRPRELPHATALPQVEGSGVAPANAAISSSSDADGTTDSAALPAEGVAAAGAASAAAATATPGAPSLSVAPVDAQATGVAGAAAAAVPVPAREMSVPFPPSLASMASLALREKPSITIRGHTGYLTFATLYQR